MARNREKEKGGLHEKHGRLIGYPYYKFLSRKDDTIFSTGERINQGGGGVGKRAEVLKMFIGRSGLLDAIKGGIIPLGVPTNQGEKD